MSRFGGLSEERPSVFKTRSKLGTHLSTQCSGDEKQSRPCAALPCVTVVPTADTAQCATDVCRIRRSSLSEVPGARPEPVPLLEVPSVDHVTQQ
ncbi:hypothetical protein TNCV_4015921 [Trichonephila clavipes]|nr:hypothetical protein TNCV_4015921 [Trichonephila clavipes]